MQKTNKKTPESLKAMENIKDEIDRVMEQHPMLHYLGYGSIMGKTPCGKRERELLMNAADEVQHVVRWLTIAPKRRTINGNSTSYGLKELCEKACGSYISNGSFICGALICGFDYLMVDNGPNTCFNISRQFVNQQWKALMP